MVNLLAEFRAKRKAIEDQQQQAKDANTEVKPNKFAKLHPHVASFVEWYQNHRLSVNTHVNIISHEHTHRIALLFIIVDHFPNELLWRCWLEQYEQVQQSAPQRHRLHIDIYIHAKERQSKQYSTWVESRLVKTFALKPTWGSVDLTKTMVALLHEAYQTHPDTKQFLFASESCLPIHPLADIEGELSSSTQSWMRFTNKADNGYALDRQFNALNEYFIKSWIFKADQWLLLHQQHVVAVLLLMLSHQLTLPTASSSTSTEDVTDGNDVSDLLTSLQSKPTKAILQSPMFSYFQQVRASDEVFFPSILAMLQCLPSDEIACRRLTYCDWSGGEARPRSFPSLLEVDPQTSSEVLLKAWDDAKTQQSIFFRKCLLMAKNYRMDRNDVKLKAAVKLWFVEMSKSSQTTDIALIDNDFETTWQRITQELENEEQEIARLAKEQEELIRKEAEEERQRHAKRGRSRSESRDRSSHQRRRGRSESRNRREYRGSEPSRSHDEGRQQRQLQEHYSRQEGRRY